MVGDPRVTDYVRKYRTQYSREAITSRLLENGTDQAVVDASWAEALQSDVPPPVGLDAIVIREYEGKSQKATGKFQADARRLAAQGYRVVSQSWDPGRRGAAGVVMLGVFAPKHGTPTVTYQLG